MTVLVDSDWIIDGLKGITGAITVLTELEDQGFTVSVVSLVEILEGVSRAADPARLEPQKYATSWTGSPCWMSPNRSLRFSPGCAPTFGARADSFRTSTS